jgi:hypothetical protein
MEEHKPLEYHGFTAGRRQTAEYQIWAQIIQRCFNPNHPKYENYGARGIDMDPRWRKSFSTFLAELGKRPSRKYSVERVDNDKGYWPDNVRWDTVKNQSRNKTTSRLVEYKGKEIPLPELAEKAGIPRKRFQARLDGGMSVEEAVKRPLKKVQKFVFHGHAHNLREWSEITGISYNTLRSRIYTKGWTLAQALTSKPE